VASIVGRLATEHHLTLCFEGAELLARHFPGMLRVQIVAPESVRAGNVMLDLRLERAAAKEALWDMETKRDAERRGRFGKSSVPAHLFDLVLNAESLGPDQMVDLIEASVNSLRLKERGYFSAAAEAQLQFHIRLRLSKFGIVPPGNVGLTQKVFAHQSEQIFANLLDFYRISWDYEPRSFPLQWDKDGRVTEAFTPDFYLHEFDLYVELTTMKQTLVTRKNRKIKMLRAVYPHINIQVFYQKDFQDLVFKHGLKVSAR
jgi:cytidylate kinase-like protein